jgi:hypothetical protein
MIRRISSNWFFDGDLGHLERDMARLADELRADLDQLFLRASSATSP